jgi:hypothetical protein
MTMYVVVLGVTMSQVLIVTYVTMKQMDLDVIINVIVICD